MRRRSDYHFDRMIIRPLYFPFFRPDARYASQKRLQFDLPVISLPVISHFCLPKERDRKVFRP
ncbi:hypothetical protein DXA67_01665 [Bacteroides fragilis]|uniref:Uncharacterized protein n=1 Tax=Bacteroides fragilis TaxID=817 RepID=A0A3E5CY74_BACFG|nr:hypothetical protein DXB57_03135 [Bacteroides fragilis]RGN65597.1 hypothetical protein DXB60_05830 [Bacteroides fragilis]RGV55083.1 hypothetical protein DWW08_09420 [Bacteroides fragilis]RGV90869.1 hypothetical protein DWW00_02980 [Bacteroides fragilis]RGX90218.1 hypothetical protein DXA67_01665 [Bacteroides fragilis]